MANAPTHIRPVMVFISEYLKQGVKQNGNKLRFTYNRANIELAFDSLKRIWTISANSNANADKSKSRPIHIITETLLMHIYSVPKNFMVIDLAWYSQNSLKRDQFDLLMSNFIAHEAFQLLRDLGYNPRVRGQNITGICASRNNKVLIKQFENFFWEITIMKIGETDPNAYKTIFCSHFDLTEAATTHPEFYL